MHDYSQNGESKLLRDFLNRIRNHSHPEVEENSSLVLVEFGGSMGTDNSNFFGIAEKDSFAIVQIEGDPKKYPKCLESMQRLSTGTAIKAWVGTKSNVDRLDAILEKNNLITRNVLGVSIDIDGDDALIFENMGFTPPLVIVEYNPTLPSEGRFRQPRGHKWGNNIGELISVAKSQEMFLVAMTRLNLIFVRNEFMNLFHELNLDESLKALDNVRYGFGYDGTLIRYSLMSGNTTREFYHHGWSNTLLKQPLPKWLRRFGSNNSLDYTRFATSVILSMFRPYLWLKFIINYLVEKRNRF